MEADGTAPTRWSDRLAVALGRPRGLVEQIRWLFALSVVLSMVSVLALADAGRTPSDASLPEMETLWQEVKARERSETERP